MHGGAAAHAEHPDGEPDVTLDPGTRSPLRDTCVMRGTCSAPIVALASLLWNPGILEEPTADSLEMVTWLADRRSSDALPSLEAVDPPPPRA